jgi:hypothetical protein
MLNKMLMQIISQSLQICTGTLKSMNCATMAKLSKTRFSIAQQNLGKEALRAFALSLRSEANDTSAQNAATETISEDKCPGAC